MRRGAVLHLGAADHRHRAGLRPHHERHRRGDDRLVRHGIALLCDAEGASGAPRPRRRQGGRHHLQDRRARRRSRQGPPGGARARRRLVAGALRVPLARPVQPVARPRDGREVPRPDPAGRGRQARAFLLDVRPQILLDADHPGDPRLRARRHGGEVEGLPRAGRRDLHRRARPRRGPRRSEGPPPLRAPRSNLAAVPRRRDCFVA